MKQLLTLLMLTGTFTAQSQVKNVLFLGNSYTNVNNLPQLVKDIALSFGDTLNKDSNTPGGYTYRLHTTNATTLSKIQALPWDYVVLQEQSQIPSLPQSITGIDYSLPHSLFLDSLIKYNNHCTETVFYMTWGRKNGDASYCGQHPPVCTYAGMQQELRNTYMLMADTNKATVSPIGVAWANTRASFPSIELYQLDESHPSLHGSYLAACVFYATLYQKSPIGSTFIPAGINAIDALSLQTVASNTVLDSLGLWRINANVPVASFNYSGGGTINFTNTSTNRATYFWDFGDGNNSSQEHPSNAYVSSGNYPVQLIVYSADSCYSDTLIQNVNVTISGIENVSNNQVIKIYPNPADNFIQIETGLKYSTVVVIDVTGKAVKEVSFKNKIDVSDLDKGVYFIQFFDNSSILKTSKLIKK